MSEIRSCAVIERLLNPYLDGELSTGERAAVEHHVAGCRSCRLALVAIERTALAVESLPRLAAPAGLLAGTMAAVNVEAAKRREASPLQPLATLTVVLITLAGIGAALVSGGESLWASLEAALEDPSTLLENLVLLGPGSDLSVILGSSVMLVAGVAAFAQLLRGEFAGRVAR